MAAGNSTYKKLAVQWLNEVLCFVSSSLLADSLVLRNRQLLVAAKRWWLPQEKIPSNIDEHNKQFCKNSKHPTNDKAISYYFIPNF